MQKLPVFTATDVAIFLFPGKKIRPSFTGHSQKALFYGVFTLAPNGYLVSITLLLSPRPWHSTSYNNPVWQCRNRYSAVKCKTTNIYDKLLFYVLHDVARKKIVAKDIRTAIVEFAADAVSADRLAAIERYIENFESMSAWKMLSDADDLSFVINRVLVKPDRSIDVIWLDGSVDGYEIPRYTPKGGISMI